MGLIDRITQTTLYQTLTTGMAKLGVDIKAWLDPTNVYLSLTQVVAELFSELRSLIATVADSMYLESATGDGLTAFAKSQYQLDRVPAQPTVGRIVLRSVASAPPYTFTPGQITIGTPGPVSASTRMYSNKAGGSLKPGEMLILEFEAAEPGSAYNIPTGTTLDLKTSFGGVSASNPATGELITMGMGNAGLVISAGDVNIYFTFRVQGPNVATTTFTKVVTSDTDFFINLASDGLSNSIATAEQVRQLCVANGAGIPGTLIAGVFNLGDGTGIVQPAPRTFMPYGSTWIASAGVEEESDDRLKLRCISRWSTIGTGGNEEALIFWGLLIPTGYKASPVIHIRVLSDYKIGGPNPFDNFVTIIIGGQLGALSTVDVAAVRANYETPKKYCIGTTIAVVSCVNKVIPVSATVNIFRDSGISIADAQASVAVAFARYQTTLNVGQTIYWQKIGGIIESTLLDAIRDVVLASPSGNVTQAFNEFPTLNIAPLIFTIVDRYP